MGDIDLRPREFIFKNEFYFPRVMMVTLFVIFVFILIAAGLFLELFIQEEILKSKELKEEYQRLKQQMMQEQEVQDSIQTMQERIDQLEMHIDIGKGWYPYLYLILNTCGNNIIIQDFQMDKEGNVNFTAGSENLKELVRFLSELKKSQMIYTYAYEQVEMEGSYGFYFQGKFIWMGFDESVG
ncbi:hypothetical protein [Candidatus Contubernalis alkaliaceticus]|uniref:hypothetical protein n=1 Tax=Candidatus Contubernalis alkaliaceticus TaxID=338645 RepID=UPI001F4BDBE1|nr:hypothetical protein [Candidatus Contubernalis alkalaceticus]UNC92569.1 hypothetical protein HUE98_10940 [Candidatus Contubernalis alkalaceticus]